LREHRNSANLLRTHRPGYPPALAVPPSEATSCGIALRLSPPAREQLPTQEFDRAPRGGQTRGGPCSNRPTRGASETVALTPGGELAGDSESFGARVSGCERNPRGLTRSPNALARTGETGAGA